MKLKVAFYRLKISMFSNHSHLVVVQLVWYFVRQSWQNPLSNHILKWCYANTMKPIKHEGETEYHSVTDMNCKQEGEVSDLNEQVDLNPSSNSLMVSKLKQWFSGAPIPTFIYTNNTVRAICVKEIFPEPIHVSFLNEYDCMLEFQLRLNYVK